MTLDLEEINVLIEFNAARSNEIALKEPKNTERLDDLADRLYYLRCLKEELQEEYEMGVIQEQYNVYRTIF
jgi:hypothetical protein